MTYVPEFELHEVSTTSVMIICNITGHNDAKVSIGMINEEAMQEFARELRKRRSDYLNDLQNELNEIITNASEDTIFIDNKFIPVIDSAGSNDSRKIRQRSDGKLIY